MRTSAFDVTLHCIVMFKFEIRNLHMFLLEAFLVFQWPKYISFGMSAVSGT